MNNLISCDNCNVVFKNNFSQCNATDREFIKGQDAIFKYLEEHKFTIHQYFGDLEQEEICFIKYCPVCKKVNYFSGV